MVGNNPTKFGSHRRCDSGNMMFLVVEGQDSTCSFLIRHYCLSVKHVVCHAQTQNFRT